MDNMDDFNKFLQSVIALLTLLAVFFVVPWAISAHFEARAFNRVTGAQVSTWDAMFLELRVDGCNTPTLPTPGQPRSHYTP